MVMAPLVLVHLGMMIYAVQGGLNADEILGRTQGSLFWALFYGLFVAAASVHGAIGIRGMAAEVLGLRGYGLTALAWGLFALFLGFGIRAVVAVVGG